MIWWIIHPLTPEGYDYHTGPSFIDDPFVKKLVYKGVYDVSLEDTGLFTSAPHVTIRQVLEDRMDAQLLD